MNNKVISIIIVNWNVKNLLLKCINLILNHYKNDDLEIIIIDNASSDGSQDMLSKYQYSDNIGVILNKENKGFAFANNQGIKIARGKYIILLNPDTEIQPDTINKTIEFMESNDDGGVLGCKILNPDRTLQPSVRNFPTFYSQILIMLKLHRLFPNLSSLKKYWANNFDYNRTQEADQVMGAFFCLPKKVIEKIGLLDEKFYIWFEEVDFCKRVRNAGLKVYYFADASIIHHDGQSFGRVLSYKKQRIFNQSMIYYFQKHGRWFEVFALKLVNPVSLILAGIASLINSKLNAQNTKL